MFPDCYYGRETIPHFNHEQDISIFDRLEVQRLNFWNSPRLYTSNNRYLR